MFRDKDEELKRLQEQLLEEEEPEEVPEDGDEILDEELLDALLGSDNQAENPKVYQNFSNDYGKNLRNFASGYKAYNSDKTDEDLDSFSEAVLEPPKSGSLAWFILVLLVLMAAVVGAILWMYIGLGGIA